MGLLAGPLRLNLRPLGQTVHRLPVETKYNTYPLRAQQPCEFIGTKGSVYIRKELNSLKRVSMGYWLLRLTVNILAFLRLTVIFSITVNRSCLKLIVIVLRS